jgi:ferrous iron transport protein A
MQPTENLATRCQTLSALPAGERGIVRALEGGREFRSRMACLGFTTGAELAVVQNYVRGPMIVSLRGTLVALGRGEADKVFVTSRT